VSRTILTKGQKKKKATGYCIGHACWNAPSGKQNWCSTCKKRRFRLAHPIRNSYNNLKTNAKRRGKVFELTFEQFREFAIKNKYVENTGKTAGSYSIDRERNEEGYTADNIRVMSLADNTIKRHEIDYGDCPF